MLCVRRWSDAGRRAGSGVCYSTLSTVPRAQNRAAKGSTLLQRRSMHLAHLVKLFIYVVQETY